MPTVNTAFAAWDRENESRASRLCPAAGAVDLDGMLPARVSGWRTPFLILPLRRFRFDFCHRIAYKISRYYANSYRSASLSGPVPFAAGRMDFMEIAYGEQAARQIKRIWKGDKKIAAVIIQTIEAYASNPAKGRSDVKTLRGKYGVFKRLRVGRYRVIFEENAGKMLIYEIKHRQEAYRD
jgi:mRNA-degrading endonuclease RelE of RelBE toxin-antitoxin system